ncbi:MAG: MotA/TolQ/ExbB proton channel family protein [Opitutales bacterium]
MKLTLHKPHGWTYCIALYLFTAVAAFAQESEGTVGTESSTSLFDLIQQGGWAMYPLGLTALFMFFLIFYCWKETVSKRFVPTAAVAPLSEALAARDVSKAFSICQNSPAVLTRSLVSALSKSRPEQADGNKEKIENTFVDSIESEDGGISQWINYLNVVAAVAPMIGLLGTVSGMISAFQTIGQVGMGDPSALAEDIGEALVTTATGLTIGIPAMIAYFVYRNRLNKEILKTVETGGDLIDAFVDQATYDPTAGEG